MNLIQLLSVIQFIEEPNLSLKIELKDKKTGDAGNLVIGLG